MESEASVQAAGNSHTIQHVSDAEHRKAAYSLISLLFLTDFIADNSFCYMKELKK
jgi:hypothetical protein